MNWLKGLRCFTNCPKSPGEIFKCGALQYSIVNEHQHGVLDSGSIITRLQQERGCAIATSFQRSGLGSKYMNLQETMILAKSMFCKFKLPYRLKGNVFGPKQYAMTISRQFGQGTQNDPNLDRNFLVQLWVADKKMKKFGGRRRRKIDKDATHGENIIEGWFSGSSTKEEKIDYDLPKPVFGQPPLSQPATGFLKPTSSEEALVAPLLARSNLLITRDIEWANLVLGFEQENRYFVVDICYPQSPVGLICEKSNVIARQLLRLRRPFVADITDALSNDFFRVRRPFWWITSSIYAEIDGKEVGVVHRRWHLWKRIYDLYLGDKQFAVVENPGFWNWTFTLKDIDGGVLAQIERDWRGFGFEIFTDAGQYVIRFGSVDSTAIIGPAGVLQELEVTRPLTLAERAVTVALAISLDNDYFSRHGGWGIPFVADE
ncbi:phospholipid scramblase family protein C343.06c [Cornus florida]|uniref:phospholipid scramblase family protein C343.06c n=1 Tax=Cornus florida TaxID=4283 RepID=UPI00289B88F9|nr:phospholipid scramblase family protein C343.06c [Cornus florida]XP_059667374.1 phospholipid scramblase family protein C343.06c [Cornus florida]XP_059667375.1 phospholipid scramblase family protein C343.06c [Cornus florida]